jgi:serine/threonine protein kinase
MTEGQLPEFDLCRALELLRSDSLAELYRGEQPDLGRTVFIKALRRGVLPSSPFALTIEREARLLSELDQENIIRIHDFRRREDTMWLVLEDARGPSLDRLIGERGRLPPVIAAAIAVQLCRALRYAHNRGVVHRDLQPRNVFVGVEGRVKLVGFSVASSERLPTAPELLDGAAEFGTPHYMSPEQVLGEPPDPRSDLFSLGVLLYETLTGKRPFDAPDSRAVTQRIRHDAPVPLSREAPDLPRSLENVVHRLLQKIPSDRFHDATELARALEGLIGKSGAEELVADFLSGPERSRAARKGPMHEARRSPSLVSGLLLCLGILMAGAAAVQYAASRSDRSMISGGSRLQLVPANAGQLRVVATPWAHVRINGELVETTPFARPIPLPPGRHYVVLEHPSAPVERRVVPLSPAESVLLDVEMKVTRTAPATSKPPPPITGNPETP